MIIYVACIEVLSKSSDGHRSVADQQENPDIRTHPWGAGEAKSAVASCSVALLLAMMSGNIVSLRCDYWHTWTPWHTQYN